MTGAGGLRALHGRLLGDRGLQFDYSTIAAPKTNNVPEWLKALARAVGKAFVAGLPALQVLFWIGVAVAVVVMALLIARELFGIRLGGRRKSSPRAAPADWRPEAWKARAVLEDADRLAAEGDYDRAARLILHRGIEDIETRRPRLIRPALTARDIAALEGVPAPAREAFTHIVRAVEASWFGARSLGPEAFAVCRQAYETFAFAEAWG